MKSGALVSDDAPPNADASSSVIEVGVPGL